MKSLHKFFDESKLQHSIILKSNLLDVSADYVVGTKPISMYDALKNRDINNIGPFVTQSTIDTAKFLPYAAETYNISPDLADYVVVPVPIFYCDIPNRNGLAFPFTEISAWNPDTGCVGWKTWVGKGTFLEHDNEDVSKAKGIILDSMLLKDTSYNQPFYKVYLLAAWDRKTHNDLANSILSGKRNAYSMGSHSADYKCSVCGNFLSKVYNSDCSHVSAIDKNRPMKVYNGKLSHRMSVRPVGFELSSVMIPAAEVARGNPLI